MLLYLRQQITNVKRRRKKERKKEKERKRENKEIF
jgi:hypothetical protein